MARVAATIVRKEFADVLNRVIYGGERIAVERYGKTVAALVSKDDLKLLEALEDRAARETAREALMETGRRSWDEVKAELAL